MKKLSPEAYHVTQENGTESPFSGKFWNHHEKGMYLCTVCGNELFHSEKKYESGTGWPSFSAPEKKEMVEEKLDESHGIARIEVICSQCGAHLGHVFDDGPSPEGKRYCINSCSLEFKKIDTSAS